MLSLTAGKHGQGETLEELGNDLDQHDINVNFDEVNFFDKQRNDFQTAQSQVSSFISKDRGRISGIVDNVEGPIHGAGSAVGSFVNQDGFNNSFRVAD